MIEFGISKGTRFYVASFRDYNFMTNLNQSGLSVIILGVRITWIDKPYNPNRKEWVIPKDAWDDDIPF